MEFDEAAVRCALLDAWSLETARQWLPDNPAAGQCNVTAVVVQDIFGGELLRTRLEGFESHHYYNHIGGRRIDLTDSQFDGPIPYDDEPTNSKAAMAFVTDDEYRILKQELASHLANGSSG
ncbi:MAG: hypothetical protein AAF764_10465 [Pseudomonadota bacterium]